jgi:hypothetical protein
MALTPVHFHVWGRSQAAKRGPWNKSLTNAAVSPERSHLPRQRQYVGVWIQKLIEQTQEKKSLTKKRLTKKSGMK